MFPSANEKINQFIKTPRLIFTANHILTILSQLPERGTIPPKYGYWTLPIAPIYSSRVSTLGQIPFFTAKNREEEEDDALARVSIKSPAGEPATCRSSSLRRQKKGRAARSYKGGGARLDTRASISLLFYTRRSI